MYLDVEIKKKLEKFDLDVKFTTESKRIGILGSSGSGKSMTLKAISGIEKIDDGKIVFYNKVLFSKKKKINLKVQKRKIGYMFQNYALFPNMTVKENIEIVKSSSLKYNIKELINKFELDKVQNKFPSEISGGEQQRVALARVIASGCEMVLLDEPFSALDNNLKYKIESELILYLDKFNIPSILVSHNIEELYKMCDYLIILSDGKAIEKGYIKEIIKRPKNVESARLVGFKNIFEIEDLDIILNIENKFEYSYFAISEHNFSKEKGDGFVFYEDFEKVELINENMYILNVKGNRLFASFKKNIELDRSGKIFYNKDDIIYFK